LKAELQPAINQLCTGEEKKGLISGNRPVFADSGVGTGSPESPELDLA
jgi:hypothetical protein